MKYSVYCIPGLRRIMYGSQNLKIGYLKMTNRIWNFLFCCCTFNVDMNKHDYGGDARHAGLCLLLDPEMTEVIMQINIQVCNN